MDYQDELYVEMAVACALKAKEKGNHPFGAVLVNADGTILLTAENSVITDNDITAHAELNLVRLASGKYSEKYLEQCSLYASTEPCPMCSGAIYWSGVRRVVFGLSQLRFYNYLGYDTGGNKMTLTCREVFARGGRQIEVVGPLLETKAEQVHHGFWIPG
jgi:tRNA(Arg) A34 adenosine deaminase TadA